MNILSTIHRAEQSATTLFAEHIGDTDITIRQVALMAAIKADPGASQTKLVYATGVDRATLAEMTRRIVRKGWVTRRRTKHDARAYAVNLTPDGLAVLAKGKTAAAKTEKALLEKFPAMKHLNGH